MKIKIEKGVKLPRRLPISYSKTPKLPFEYMKVGDSFRIKQTTSQHMNMSAKRFKARYRPLWDFTTRTLKDNSVRIWRTK